MGFDTVIHNGTLVTVDDRHADYPEWLDRDSGRRHPGH
jgi:hypothetical protein